MSTATAIVLCIAIVLLGLLAWQFLERRKTVQISKRFGPEYDKLAEVEGARRATSILEARQKRLSQLDIRPLNREECARFADEWRVVQERFVDDPQAAIVQADGLVNNALKTRGFPMTAFEQQAADLSVEHPHVVENYRIAHAIAEARQSSTEDLRRAMQHFRRVMEGVLDTRIGERMEVR